MRSTMQDECTSIEVRGTIVVSNSYPYEIVLTLEPWYEQYTMLPGVAVEVDFCGPSGGRLELEMRQNEIIIYGWSGSVVSVHPQSERTKLR